jgi:hypothetical protein
MVRQRDRHTLLSFAAVAEDVAEVVVSGFTRRVRRILQGPNRADR